jgi:SAM-dependent methyltransferase
MRPEEIKEKVREHYAGLVSENKKKTPKRGEAAFKGKMAKMAGYSDAELSSIPEGAVGNSFGCGNPLAYAEVKEGETVLDLGSGAGIDCFLAAEKVGPQGRVIGLDMTTEMIQKATQNACDAGITNVEFRLGEMEAMPVEDASVDWVISNCVINLSPDKPKVFSEAFRVLKPGGTLLVSDIVTQELPDCIKSSDQAWCGCVAGAIEEEAYLDGLRQVGFENVNVVDRLAYDAATLNAFLKGASSQPTCCGGPETGADSNMPDLGAMLEGRILSVKVHARKPA